MTITERKKPLALIILDGWGYTENDEWNAISAASKPNWDKLWHDHPHTLIRASGAEVGLPSGQMGNSEVGHLNIGAGRVVYQEFTRVSRSIKTGSFFTNSTLTDAADAAIENNSAIHIMGLLSPGGVHSHEEHIHAMIRLAVERGVKHVYLHAFLDGRDTPPRSAKSSLKAVQSLFSELGNGQIVSIVGRYFAMDRDQRWPRVQVSYDLITRGKAEFTATNAIEGLELAYSRGETDEFVQATTITSAGEKPVQLNDGDIMIFMNYRSDRAREITRAFIEEDFNRFERAKKVKLGSYVTLTEYKAEYNVPVAFPPERLSNCLGEYISNQGMRQLRIAETEKYAHVTFFFNGGREIPFEWEDRVLIPSPNVATYDLQPEMNSNELTDKLINAIASKNYDVIICNFANPDMVGHTGNFEATVKAIETLDSHLGRVMQALDHADGEAIITADHGNAEKMRDVQSGQPHTAHTSNLVPMIYYGKQALQLSDNGSLSDIAPTMLEMMCLQKPIEMNGNSLLLHDIAENQS
jgi:2,3-bisphosphoglycerate-independent phosphoglycerate mutase